MAKAAAANTGGWGDIFAVNTPYINQLSNQLAAEEKARQLQQQKASQLLDEQMSRSLANVRTPDIGDISKAYGDWKLANMALINKHNVTPEQRLQVLAKKADLYKSIQDSKDQKAYEEMVQKGYNTNPDKYEDDTHNKLMQSIQTPLSQLGDLRGYDYSYKGTNTDFGKMFKDATGTPKEVYTQEEPYSTSQTKVTPYTYGNTPLQYHDILIGALAKRGAGRDAAALVSNIDPQDLKSVQDEYNAIPVDKWKKMGVDKPQDLTITPDDSKAEIFAKHNAQLYALNNEPKQGTYQLKTNQDVLRQQRLQDANTKAANQDALIRGRMNLSQGYKKAYKDYTVAKDAGEQENVLNKFNDNTYNAGTTTLNGANLDHVTIDGKDYKGRVVDIPKTLQNSFSIYSKVNGVDTWTKPDAYYMTDDKTKIIPLFLGSPTGTNKNQYITKDSKPVSMQNYKAELSKLLLTKSKTGNEVTDEDASSEYGAPQADQTQQPPLPQTPTGTVKIQVNGKILQGKKEDLNKLDKAGIKYKLVK